METMASLFSKARAREAEFTQPSRRYPGILSDQTGQNYDTLIFDDVASPFAE
jgi:hypothetical protein